MASRVPSPNGDERRHGPSGGFLAIALLVLVSLGWWVFSGNGPGGPEGNAQRLAVPDTEVTGAASPGAPVSPTDVPGSVRIDGYVPQDGNRVALNYTAGVPRCVGRLDTPRVVENEAAVTVTLLLVPPPSPRPSCSQVADRRTVRIDLDAPLRGRSLLDGSRAQPTRVEQDSSTNE